ncbi:TRAP transporter substrate-binding protein [Zwartia sp.]|uniref:TRAP transporter substrate-binding protein n=1 Tax=Zwartia sp. TaxID=2978004 RepID=UPI00271AE4C2|nr:TRAP transporter substrate-binding protein [Zwartia sp.]MDO9023254.1 TRAP transporter substrate-binding protein [Zwartia sp.]
MNKFTYFSARFLAILPPLWPAIVSAVSLWIRTTPFRQVVSAGVLCIAPVISIHVIAQELPQTELKVVGGLSTRLSYAEVEQPFWHTTLPERSDDRVKAQIKGFDELGIKGPELLRLMSQGVIEFGVIPLSYYLSDVPLFEAFDIAGLSTDSQSALDTATALMPVVTHYLDSTHQIKLLGINPYQPQIFFCNAEVRSLADLRGKTVRVVTRTQAELLDALGAKSVNLPFQEVLAALKNKSITCAVASATAGFNAKWYSGSSYLYALPIGWNLEFHAVNQKVWDKLEPQLQKFLASNVDLLVQSLWTYSDKLSQLGIACNIGAKTCTNLPKGQMTLVQPTAADIASVRRISIKKVLPQWASRCSESCVADYNQTVGKLLKVVVKK